MMSAVVDKVVVVVDDDDAIVEYNAVLGVDFPVVLIRKTLLLPRRRKDQNTTWRRWRWRQLSYDERLLWEPPELLISRSMHNQQQENARICFLWHTQDERYTLLRYHF